MSTTAEVGLSPMQRLWIYQAERFPLAKTAVLLAVFAAAGLSLSAHLGGRSLPPIWVFVAVWLVAIGFLFQLRVADEFKDFDDDSRYRPERPVPRGLVSLKLLRRLGLATAALAIVLSATISPPLLLPLALVWLWLGLMTAEFFVPAWLKARPLLYLVSHMAIMAFIDFYVTAAEWLPHSALPPPGIWIFVILSGVNGCVLEFGRKTWAPESERPGVETYSALYGPGRSAAIWAGCCVLSYILVGCIGTLAGAGIVIWVLGLAALLPVLWLAGRFMRQPDLVGQKRIDLVAGLWVFACYVMVGLAGPLS